MEAGFLAEEEVQNTRPLWEEVFAEDSREFTDYYFANKAEHNLTFIRMDGEQIVSMLHLTPYLTGQNEPVCYIVGVATKAEYRRQGLMDSMIKEAFAFMWEEGQPFTFLMPANPAYYTPYDFTYIYDKPEWKLNEEHLPAKYLDAASGMESGFELLIKDAGTLRVRTVKENDFAVVAQFANAWLEENTDCYMLRSAHYYKNMKKELLAQNGNLFMIEKDGALKGLLSYTKEQEKPALQEVLFKKELDGFGLIKAEGRKPLIMGRILCVEEFLKGMTGLGEMDFMLEVKDGIIPENNSVYAIYCGRKGEKLSCKKVEASKLKDGRLMNAQHAISDCRITIKDLTAFCFGQKEAKEVFEISENGSKENLLTMLSAIKPRSRIFINEIV